jgi:hypothetical protein
VGGGASFSVCGGVCLEDRRPPAGHTPTHWSVPQGVGQRGKDHCRAQSLKDVLTKLKPYTTPGVLRVSSCIC